jgi:type II secretory ATPase GspE/PulE/Tfp pilus assembly ATPase PilB-like protein
LVNKIILDACNTGASDVHVEPFEKKVVVRYRKDGNMYEAMSLPSACRTTSLALKIMAKMDIAEKRRPQDGKFQMKIANKAIDFRVSVLPVSGARETVFRILDSATSRSTSSRWVSSRVRWRTSCGRVRRPTG